jgi:hypothetical protein
MKYYKHSDSINFSGFLPFVGRSFAAITNKQGCYWFTPSSKPVTLTFSSAVSD